MFNPVSLTKQKLQANKPDPVTSHVHNEHKKWSSFICPNNYLKGSICLPIGSGEQPFTGCPVRRPMWHFSMQGLPSRQVTLTGRELLPHVFTLVPTLRSGQLFSVALSVPDKSGPGCSPVHCSVLSGLSSLPPKAAKR